MSNFLTKILFRLKSPRLIVVAGDNKLLASEAIFQILNVQLKTRSNLISKYWSRAEIISQVNWQSVLKNKFLILYSDTTKDWQSWLVKAKKPILVITASEPQEIMKLVKNWPAQSILILNFNEEIMKRLINKSSASIFTFGFQKRVDLQASNFHADANLTNFKVAHQGNVVPVWLESQWSRENLAAILAAISCCVQLGFNLVEISQSLKIFKRS